MHKYEVIVTTTYQLLGSTLGNIYIKLVGTDGESDRTWLQSFSPLDFTIGNSATFTVRCPDSLGELVLIELDKERPLLLPKKDWFPASVTVKSPEGDVSFFPVHRWIVDHQVHRFRSGKALKVYEDDHFLGQYDRQQELKGRAQDYSWDVEQIPHCMEADEALNSLPLEDQFSATKTAEFTITAALAQLRLKDVAERKEPWTDFDAIEEVFFRKTTKKAEYVQKVWREDEFFGYQFLNGVNPMMIKRCSVLPENFPVPDDLVLPQSKNSLKREMKNGNIYLCDYKNLDGVPANVVNEKQQFMAAPLVLLFKTPDDKLMPVAIQLKQTPGDDNPIFYPTDSEYDWLTAKTFVRSADFSEHQVIVHLLRTHLLAEVFAVSLLRNFPMVHPLYKLLVPHTRYTLQINHLARNLLISENGVFTEYAACGGEGVPILLERALASTTYSSLCLPDYITACGLMDIPNFYFRDDGLCLWDIVLRFVEGVITYYYKDDTEVVNDTELQTWIKDIFEHGFLSEASTGIPQEFSTVTELVKFVTMVMFTCSVQHTAVNAGQYDFGAWMPNTPITLQRPPPTTKNTTSEETLLATLPDANATAQGMSTMYLLSKPFRSISDYVPLGNYPEMHFSEDVPRELMKKFRGDLKKLSEAIGDRNETLDVKYDYLDPEKIENSVAL